jgi:multiple sugar transport system permease protein
MARAKNNENSASASLRARRAIAYIVLIFFSLLCLIWFYFLLINTTKTHQEITSRFKPVPGSNFANNWKNAMSNVNKTWVPLRNSVIISALSALLCVYFSTMTAYAIHTYEFKLKKFMYTFILAVMMIPTQVTALGFINLMNKVGLMDSFIPLIIPSIAAPATFFYMKQYMDSTLPLEIIEASRIDGAGEFRTFNQIILPIMKPAIAVQAIFTFVSSWNNYFMPARILNSSNKKTLPIIIAELRSEDYANFDMGKVYMMIAFAIFPVVIVYLFLSKYIVGGVAMGAVKG